MKRLACILTLLILFWPCGAEAETLERWSVERANEWSRRTGWLVGCNYIPRTAINQLEMWQADTFDPETIDQELGWAHDLGFNSIRVFLHDLLWEQDRRGFLARMDQFLEIADRHHIGVVFVPLDAVWDPHPKLGKQREPRPHVHNSGWVQAPSIDILKDESQQDRLEPYITGILKRFRNDRRIHAWDLYNEPGNKVPQYLKVSIPNKEEMSLVLLRKVLRWAREAAPSQPLTVGVWAGEWTPDKVTSLARLQLENSDVISFHNYGKLADMKRNVELLKTHHRPILCTEYMARTQGSTFDPILGYLKEQHVGAYNWGFVSGKTNTIYPWDSWTKEYKSEPDPWFHDILRPDGTPYRQAEVDYIRRVTDAGGRERK